MPYYSDEIIEEVRSRTDIVDVISQYVNLQKKGTQYFGLCPFHNEKTGSFSVSPQKQMYYCFGCGAGGNVFSFLMAYENINDAPEKELVTDKFLEKIASKTNLVILNYLSKDKMINLNLEMLIKLMTFTQNELKNEMDFPQITSISPLTFSVVNK